MSIVAGNTIDAADFVATHGGTADSGKVGKLDANGELLKAFMMGSSAEADQSQTTQNATQVVGEANATTKANLLAQSFTAGRRKISGVKLWKTTDTGTFTGTVKIALQANSSGNPSGSDLASITLSNEVWLALATGEFFAFFTTEYASLAIGTTYWIVVTCSTSDNSNHPNLGTNSAGGYSGGSVKRWNTTDGWVAIATIDLYFKTIEGRVSMSAFTETGGMLPNDILPSRKLDRNLTQTSGGTSTTSEATLMRLRIPAGVMTATGWIEYEFYISNIGVQNTAAVTIRVYLGGTVIASITCPPTNSFSWQGLIRGRILANGATNSQKCWAFAEFYAGLPDSEVAAADVISKALQMPTTAPSVDMTVDNILKLTTQFNLSHGSNITTVDWGTVKLCT